MKKLFILSVAVLALQLDAVATGSCGVRTLSLGKYKRHKLLGVSPKAGETVATITTPEEAMPKSVKLKVFVRRAVVKIGTEKFVVDTKNFEKGEHPIIVNYPSGAFMTRLTIIK